MLKVYSLICHAQIYIPYNNNKKKTYKMAFASSGKIEEENRVRKRMIYIKLDKINGCIMGMVKLVSTVMVF